MPARSCATAPRALSRRGKTYRAHFAGPLEIVVCDKGYVDYGWYQALTARGVYFVTRQKTRAVLRVVLNHAVMTQVWIALCAWLLVWFLKVISKTDWSLQRLMRVLQLNVLAKQELLALARGTPPPEPASGQLGLGV